MRPDFSPNKLPATRAEIVTARENIRGTSIMCLEWLPDLARRG